MGWILLIALDILAPTCDWLEDAFRVTHANRFVGEIKIQGNIETDDSEIRRVLLLQSAQRIKNWRVAASEWLLFFIQGDKLDLKNKQRPRVTFETPPNDSKYFNLVVSFPEKSTGLRVEQERIDKLCEQAVIRYVKALQSKDQIEAGKIVAVPWLAEKEKVLRNVAELSATLRSTIAQSPNYDSYLAGKSLVMRYSQVRHEVERDEVRKLFDEVLGRDGRIVNLSKTSLPFAWRNVFVRVKQGVAQVVGGPYKATYLMMDNTFPPSAKEALENSTAFELLSLNPIRNTGKDKSGFYGFDILGKTQLKDTAMKKRVVAAFQQAIEESEGLAAGCFNPRHGFRIIFDKKTYEFVICYECMQIDIYENGKRLRQVLTTGKAQAVLDSVLQQAGVPLAEKSK